MDSRLVSAVPADSGQLEIPSEMVDGRVISAVPAVLAQPETYSICHPDSPASQARLDLGSAYMAPAIYLAAQERHAYDDTASERTSVMGTRVAGVLERLATDGANSDVQGFAAIVEEQKRWVRLKWKEDSQGSALGTSIGVWSSIQISQMKFLIATGVGARQARYLPFASYALSLIHI